MGMGHRASAKQGIGQTGHWPNRASGIGQTGHWALGIRHWALGIGLAVNCQPSTD